MEAKEWCGDGCRIVWGWRFCRWLVCLASASRSRMFKQALGPRGVAVFWPSRKMWVGTHDVVSDVVEICTFKTSSMWAAVAFVTWSAGVISVL